MILNWIILAASAATLPPMPSETPQRDEILITGQSDPVAVRCADTEAKMQKALHLTALKVVVTKDRKWGTIWRADRAFPRRRDEPPIVLRSVCWSSGPAKDALSTLETPVDIFDRQGNVPLLK